MGGRSGKQACENPRGFVWHLYLLLRRDQPSLTPLYLLPPCLPACLQTGAAMLRQTMVKAANDTSDELSLKRLAQQKFVDHERSLQEERSGDLREIFTKPSVPWGATRD